MNFDLSESDALRSSSDSPLQESTEHGSRTGPASTVADSGQRLSAAHDGSVGLDQRIEDLSLRLAAKTRELEHFCYMVSHDLKAPLRGIHGYSRFLIEDYSDKLDENGKRYLRNVCSASLHATQLVDDLLAYSKLERRELTPVKLELRRVVDDQIAALNKTSSNVAIDVRVDSVALVTDYQNLATALCNLIDNAVKFSSRSPHPAIEICAHKTNDTCFVSVHDNGSGFDMRSHEKIFGIFQRLHSAEEFPGTGIGLALVHKAMERIGGRVWGDSEIGAGTTFFLEFPATDVSIPGF